MRPPNLHKDQLCQDGSTIHPYLARCSIHALPWSAVRLVPIAKFMYSTISNELFCTLWYVLDQVHRAETQPETAQAVFGSYLAELLMPMGKSVEACCTAKMADYDCSSCVVIELTAKQLGLLITANIPNLQEATNNSLVCLWLHGEKCSDAIIKMEMVTSHAAGTFPGCNFNHLQLFYQAMIAVCACVSCI